MEFFNVVSVEEARNQLKSMIDETRIKIERIPLQESLHRYVAQDVIAQEDLPAYHRSTVDGYGVHWEDVQGANESIPSYLSLAGQVVMGTFYHKPLTPWTSSLYPNRRHDPKRGGWCCYDRI
jgi:molybdopterin molybdotransferase